MTLSNEALEFLERNLITNYVVTSSGTVDVHDDTCITTYQHKFPVKFGRVTGCFNCERDHLVSLEGSPTFVSGDFSCNGNLLTSLKGAPAVVQGSFYCDDNYLTSLDYVPAFIGKSLSCYNNSLTHLHDIHKYLKEIHRDIYLYNNLLKSSVLGLLLIKGAKEAYIDNRDVQNIINRNLGRGRGAIIDAQRELIEAGYEEYAKL